MLQDETLLILEDRSNMKVIRITKCFDDCPHCTGPDCNQANQSIYQYTCQEMREWIDDEDTIPDWCPLEEE